jgi:outer membrane protein assembly factor BamB
MRTQSRLTSLTATLLVMLTRPAWLAAVGVIALSGAPIVPQPASQLPSTPLRYGFFTITFGADGTFAMVGKERGKMKGTWKIENDELVVANPDHPGAGCQEPGRYKYKVDGTRVILTTVADACVPRQMVLRESTWRPEGEADAIPTRPISRSGPERTRDLPVPAPAKGSWPSFRGPSASGVADGQDLPETWNTTTNQNILWRTPIPGLAHSSPVIWGNRIFVTSAISSRGNATFKPGLYGDGDASDDRSSHKWMLYAIDNRTGHIVWERVAFEGEPRNKRHIKSTYASASPATDGRIVVAWFGSQGVHAYDVDGNHLWTVDLGRVDMGAYDIPSYEWGPASSPIIWNDMVFIQCDTQADSFLLALEARTGKTIWKADREELPSWGTPTVVRTSAGEELVTNASNFIRGYDPRTGKELWKLGGSSKITAPTPFVANGLVLVASGRAPERPLFAIRPGARGDLTLAQDQTSSAAVAWSKTGRGSYVPTPLVYDGILYVLANNGVFDAYEVETGKEIYRQRLEPVGSGFSASPVAADGRIYLISEDGDIIVIAAGREFRKLGSNAMGELVMATPALSDGAMYVRGVSTLFAIGKRR